MEQYIKEGIQELDDVKLSPLLQLKYDSIADAKQQLENVKEIRAAFVGFQAFLYRDQAG